MLEAPERSPTAPPVGATVLETRDSAPFLRRHLPAIAVFLIGVAVSLAAFTAYSVRQRERARLAFERRATEVVGSLEVGLDLPIEVLRSLPALFDASLDVSREEFRVFTRGALERYPGIYALEWLPYVSAAERTAYEARARRDGLEGFRFKEDSAGVMVPAAERPMYMPIYFMEPPNEIALGFDLTSEPDRLAPALRAAETGGTVASSRIRLVEDDPSIYSIAVFHPVYHRDRPLETADQRLAALRGVAAEVFRVAPMVERALRLADTEGMELVLIDESGPAEMRLLYESQPGIRGATNRGFSDRIHFPFADREWAAVLRAGAGYAGAWSPAWSTLAAGLLLSALLSVGLGTARTIVRLRKQMRAALKLGQYTLEERLGQGAMGVVYRASHALLRRPTAVKLLPPGEGGEARLARFEREVQLTSRLTHPNTIAIYDFGRTKEGLLYYAMEYLDGLSFAELVERYGPLPAPRVVHLLEQICGALAEAHDAGLIHRDIKPQNLMLCVQGGIADFVKVLDFGLVKELKNGAADLSQPGTVMGTPLYMSPEAIRSPGDVDGRSDLYSLAAVAFYLLTGSPVFEGENLVEVCSQHLSSEPIAPSARSELPIPPSLDHLILRCLAKQLAERPQSATELLALLEGLADVEEWTQAEARAWWKLHEPLRYERSREGRRPVS